MLGAWSLGWSQSHLTDLVSTDANNTVVAADNQHISQFHLPDLVSSDAKLEALVGTNGAGIVAITPA